MYLCHLNLVALSTVFKELDIAYTSLCETFITDCIYLQECQCLDPQIIGSTTTERVETTEGDESTVTEMTKKPIKT